MNRASDDLLSEPIQFPRVYRGKGMSIISVTGGKGGVGKSSLSANLAIALNDLGGRVLLLDGDLAMANADQMLGVHVPTTMYDVITAKTEMKDAIVTTPWGISLLCASSGRSEMAELDEVTRASLIDEIKKLGADYDYVVIDTAAGIGGVSVDLAAAADLVLAVATPDPASVRDVFAIMKVLSKEKGVGRISLVPNMVATKNEGVDLFKRISGVAARFLPLKLGLGGVVVKDPIMQKSIRERLPITSVYPDANAAKQICQVASYVLSLEREQTETEEDRGQA